MQRVAAEHYTANPYPIFFILLIRSFSTHLIRGQAPVPYSKVNEARLAFPWPL
jgi:hypothetical protein